MLSRLLQRLEEVITGETRAQRDERVNRRLGQLVDVPCPACGANIVLAEIDDVGEIETCTACDTPWLVTKWQPEAGPIGPHELHLIEFSERELARREAHAPTS